MSDPGVDETPTSMIGGSYIEGVGDDLVQFFVFAVVTLIPVAVCMCYWFRQNGWPGIAHHQQTIHADSQSEVADVREQIHRQQVPLSSNGANSNVAHQQQSRRRDHDLTCPVCISEARFPVETNCGHVFCGQCMMTYWEIRNRLAAVRCPSCRQQVTILLTCFSDAETQDTSADKQQIVDGINRYNRRFSGQPLSWMEYLMDLPTLLRHCISEVLSLSGLIWMFRLRVLVCFLFALLYLVSPLDILPEAIFGFFGLLDDVFVVLIMAIYVSIIYRRLIAARAEAAAIPPNN
jgi:RING finger protein 170